MKNKTIFCMIFMLILFVSVRSFAFTQPKGCLGEEAFSILDTVVVCECERTPVYAASQKNSRAQEKKEVGVEIWVKFSNGMEYTYIGTNQDLAKELREKGPNHIYNIFIGDVVVVKVVMTPFSQRIVEFIKNLSAR